MGTQRRCVGRRKSLLVSSKKVAPQTQQHQEQHISNARRVSEMGMKSRVRLKKLATASSGWITPIRTSRSPPKQNQQIAKANTYQLLDKPGSNRLVNAKGANIIDRKGGGEIRPHTGMINILCWKVRGLNSPNKHREVKILCNEVKAEIVGLLETKIKKYD